MVITSYKYVCNYGRWHSTWWLINCDHMKCFRFDELIFSKFDAKERFEKINYDLKT